MRRKQQQQQQHYQHQKQPKKGSASTMKRKVIGWLSQKGKATNIKNKKAIPPTASNSDTKNNNQMAVKETNDRLLNGLAVIPPTKWEDNISAKDFRIFKIDMKNYRKLKSEFYHYVGHLQKDSTQEIYKGLSPRTPQACEKEIGEESTCHYWSR